jgi:hypothetical protein
MRPERDWKETESLGAFSLETETRPGRDLNKFSRFPIFCDETKNETNLQMDESEVF